MNDNNDRLRRARGRAGFSSARSAALRFGWTPSAYASHENGQTPVPVKDAPKYARAFKVSPAWLLTGEGLQKFRNIIKVMGRVGAGAAITPQKEQVPPEGLAEIGLPFAFPENVIAFEVDGASLWSRYDLADIIVCGSGQREPLDPVGEEAAVCTRAGHRYLRRLRRGVRHGLFDLESFNAEAIRGVRIAAAHEVLAIVRAGQWHALNEVEKPRAPLSRPA
jgi:hypothetical protein